MWQGAGRPGYTKAGEGVGGAPQLSQLCLFSSCTTHHCFLLVFRVHMLIINPLKVYSEPMGLSGESHHESFAVLLLNQTPSV